MYQNQRFCHLWNQVWGNLAAEAISGKTEIQSKRKYKALLVMTKFDFFKINEVIMLPLFFLW